MDLVAGGGGGGGGIEPGTTECSLRGRAQIGIVYSFVDNHDSFCLFLSPPAVSLGQICLSSS